MYRFVGTLASTSLVTNTKGLQAEVNVLIGMDEFDMLRRRWYYQIAGSNDSMKMIRISGRISKRWTATPMTRWAI